MFAHRLCRFSGLLLLAITSVVWGVQSGDVAPDFAVTRVTDKAQTALSDFYGRSNVILTILLQTQSLDTPFLSALQRKTESFTIGYNAVIITVTPESVEEANHSRPEGFTLELYSDPERVVPAAYGASKLTDHGKTVYQPATFIIDKSGHIRWTFYGETPADRPSMEQLASELAKLKRSAPLPVGSPAPDFSLTEADGKTNFTLSDYRGKKNVLVTLLLQTY